MPLLVMLTVMYPSCVNFNALPIRFTKICVSLVASPSNNSGKDSSITNESFNCFSATFGLNIFSTDRTNARILKGVVSMRIIPASILDKSSMSLMIVNKFSLDFSIVSTYSLVSASSCFLCNNWVKPIIAFKGVRISWLIFAIKFSFICAAFFSFLSEIFNSSINRICLLMVFIVYQNNAAALISTKAIRMVLNLNAFEPLLSIIVVITFNKFFLVLSILCTVAAIESVSSLPF